MANGGGERQEDSSMRIPLENRVDMDSAQMYTDTQIQIRCLRPELLSGEDFEDISRTEEFQVRQILVKETIHVTSPLSSLGGESTAYYYDQMQVEACATPMGLGMEDGATVALWNPSKFPKGTDGKKKKWLRKGLRESIIELTSIEESVKDLTLATVMNPVISALSGHTVGLARPPELISHTCTSKEDVNALLKRVADSISKLRVTDVEWARANLFKEVELELGFSSTLEHTDESPGGTLEYRQQIWAKSSSADEKFFKKVVFTVHVNFDGVPGVVTRSVTSPPYTLSLEHCLTCAFKINFEIFYSKLDGDDGVMTVEHEFSELDRDEDMNLKWKKTLKMGHIGTKFDAGTVEDKKISLCLAGLFAEIETGEFKNMCEVISGLLSWSNRCIRQKEGSHKEELKMPDNEESPCRVMRDIFKYCDGFNHTCVMELLHTSPSTFTISPGEWMRWALYVGPVRNSSSSDRRSLLPIVRLMPHLAKGTVDDLVRIWKHYASGSVYAKNGFSLPEGPFYVMYNGKAVEIGSNTKFTDIVDQSLTKHYFAIPLPGTETRTINQLMKFIEGSNTGEQKRKKRKSRKKEGLKNGTVEQEDNQGLDQAQNSLASIEIDPDNSEQTEVALPEFVEGTDTDEQKRKKRKSRKKEGSKNAPVEEGANEGLEQEKGTLAKMEKDLPNFEECKATLTEVFLSRSRDTTREFPAVAPSFDVHDHETVLKSINPKKSGLSEPGNRENEIKLPGEEGDVNICHEVEQGELGTLPTELDSIGETNMQALREELARKEAKLGELWDRSQAFVETRGREMSVLVSAVEDSEEEKHSLLKQVDELDVEMIHIREELVRSQERRDQLMKDVEEKDDFLKESLKKKKQLEDLIETEVDLKKQSRGQLEKEIGSLQARIDHLTKDEADTVDKANLEAQRFLLNINKKIEAKESDLECPVCLEVSAAPIFSCDEQHLICSDCRPKVKILKLEILFSLSPRFRSQSVPSAEKRTQINREGIVMQRKQLRSWRPSYWNGQSSWTPSDPGGHNLQLQEAAICRKRSL